MFLNRATSLSNISCWTKYFTKEIMMKLAIGKSKVQLNKQYIDTFHGENNSFQPYTFIEHKMLVHRCPEFTDVQLVKNDCQISTSLVRCYNNFCN
jgi:hypothetical protein